MKRKIWITFFALCALALPWATIVSAQSARVLHVTTSFATGGGWIDLPVYPAPLPFFDGSYYELVESQNLTWDQANDAANAMNLVGCEYPHLVTITSQEEQDALYGLFGNAMALKWLGAHQMDGAPNPAADWQWVTNEPWDYENWQPNEPNDQNGNENALMVGGGGTPSNGGWIYDGKWNDAPADVTYSYIVEYDNCLTGKANFGFVSRYQKGASVPTGNTEFQFHAAGLNFHSDSYEWLVVTGSDYARFKGVGTINGEGEYKFMLWAGDDDPDTFRIKIWTEDEVTAVETVIYDNGFDQEIGGGSIVIHK